MKIFLSHRSGHKSLVREFKKQLPDFLSVWLDEESLMWGDSITHTLENTIRADIDFLIIFLDKDSLESTWVQKELNWALEREKKENRVFVLPVFMDDLDTKKLPRSLSGRFGLEIRDNSCISSVESLAAQATAKLFPLVINNYKQALNMLEEKQQAFTKVLDSLSRNQIILLDHIVKLVSNFRFDKFTGKYVPLSSIREHFELHGMNYDEKEFFYRLEQLVLHGILDKRKIVQSGRWAEEESEDNQWMGDSYAYGVTEKYLVYTKNVK